MQQWMNEMQMQQDVCLTSYTWTLLLLHQRVNRTTEWILHIMYIQSFGYCLVHGLHSIVWLLSTFRATADDLNFCSHPYICAAGHPYICMFLPTQSTFFRCFHWVECNPTFVHTGNYNLTVSFVSGWVMKLYVQVRVTIAKKPVFLECRISSIVKIDVMRSPNSLNVTSTI